MLTSCTPTFYGNFILKFIQNTSNTYKFVICVKKKKKNISFVDIEFGNAHFSQSL